MPTWTDYREPPALSDLHAELDAVRIKVVRRGHLVLVARAGIVVTEPHAFPRGRQEDDECTEKEVTDTAHYLIVDIEATCDDREVGGGRGAVPKHEMEIIEIGAVLVDATSLAVVEEFQRFVRPVRHPVLTPFCTRLTSIVQADVNGAPLFPVALDALRRFIGDRSVVFASWGDYDRKQFERDAERHRVSLPFRQRHANIKQMFAQALGEKRLGVGQALARVGLTFTGTPHRGIDDARNIARLLPWALGRVAAPAIPLAQAERGRGRERKESGR